MFLRGRRKDPVIFMIVALLCAAALVIYHQQRALLALDRQTVVILQKVAEQTTADVLDSIRRKFDGPVFDVLASIKHPHLVEDRLASVAPAFAHGLAEYPQVERFFVWMDVDGGLEADNVLFYDRSRATQPQKTGVRRPADAFTVDPTVGRIIKEAALRHATSQNIYAAFQAEVGRARYDFFLRTFYTDAARTKFFAVLGFIVNLDAVRRDLFPNLVANGLEELLSPASGGPAFDMRIHDEEGRQVFGPSGPLPAVSAQRSFNLVFYPADDVGPLMAATVPERKWKLTLSQQEGPAPALIAYTRRQTYWVSSLSVLLICVALAFALQARARADELERMQSEFVMNVSHQLKTPVSLLSAVGETIELVRNRSSEKLDQCLDIIKTETTRLSALVDHILEFSSVNGGKRRFELEPVALGPLVRETAESFAAALAPTGFHVEVQEHAAPVVAADPVALEQVVVNLLDNAIKYSGESRKVTLRLSTDGSHARIDVIDRGIGIDPRDRARIFERFYRGAGASAHRPGFGLGLAIAQQLLAGQGGRLDVDSTPGGGSTFRITLPLSGSEECTPPVKAARWFTRAGTRALDQPGKESV
jgi:signal transduction histidine kinase